MKLCIKCKKTFRSATWGKCPYCDFTPDIIEGFQVFSPDLAQGNDGFDESQFKRLASIEDGHFWFESRNLIILHLLRKYFKRGGSYLEIGCGTGFVLRAILAEGQFENVTGSEIYIKGLNYSKQRIKNACTLFQVDGRNIPYTEEFDTIGIYDCLEHITEDNSVLLEIQKALKPGGGLVLTVPQHPLLWSEADEVACHKRRYIKEELISQLENSGFQVIYASSFVSLLLPMMWANRLFRRLKPSQVEEGYVDDGMKLPPFVNRIFSLLMYIEYGLIKCGISLPFGGSLAVVARKHS